MTCQKDTLNRKLSLGFWLTNQVHRYLSVSGEAGGIGFEKHQETDYQSA